MDKPEEIKIESLTVLELKSNDIVVIKLHGFDKNNPDHNYQAHKYLSSVLKNKFILMSSEDDIAAIRETQQ
jgi:hypothetical protein